MAVTPRIFAEMPLSALARVEGLDDVQKCWHADALGVKGVAPVLFVYLQCEKPAIREAAAQALSLHLEPDVVSALRTQLSIEEVPFVQRAIEDALYGC